MLNSALTPQRKTASTPRKKTEANATMIITITVVIMVSRRVGHVTLSVSARTCWMNSNGFVFAMIFKFPMPGPSAANTAYFDVAQTEFNAPGPD